jgi:hypothetical protein
MAGYRDSSTPFIIIIIIISYICHKTELSRVTAGPSSLSVITLQQNICVTRL